MLELKLSHHARAHVWFGNLSGIPPLPVPETRGAALVMHADPQARLGHTAVAIELAVPTGGRLAYGLLGATFEDKSKSDVELLVESAPDGEKVSSALLKSVYPCCGLPVELVPAIYEGLRAVAGRLPAGRLTVTHAVYAPVIATPEIFKTLATLIVHALLTAPNDANVAALARVVEDLVPRFSV